MKKLTNTTMNRKIKVAFYKESKSFFGGLIRFQQNFLQKMGWEYAQYSHVEIVFCKPTEEEVLDIGFQNIQDFHKIISTDIFFSSSERDGGSRFKQIHVKKYNWDFIEIEVTQEQYTKMLSYAISQNKRPYGWAGIFFAQFLNYNIKNSWISRVYLKIFEKHFGDFCSEVCTKLLHSGLGSYFSQSIYKNYEVFINPAKLNKRLKRIT